MSRSLTRAATATRGFLSGLSRSVRWARTPLGSLGLAAVVSALCGMFLHPQGFVVGFGVLGVTALGLGWPWMSVRGLTGTLDFDRARCREGESVLLRFTLRNRMPWTAWGVSVRGALGSLACVPGRRTTVESVAFVPTCRGVYPADPPRVGCGFPFGLWEATRPLDIAAPLVVWPRTYPVAALPDGPGGQLAEGLAVRDRAGTWGDPLGVRPYRRGDSLRHVHWGQTARHGELIVCEVQSNAVPRVQLVLDTHPAAHAGEGPDGSREWAIRVAASLAEGWTGQGADVGLVLDGPAPPRGRSIPARTAVLLDALARLGPAGSQDLAALLDRPECRRFEQGLRVIVTTDLGLRALRAVWPRRASERFVVLRAAAFGGGDASPPLPLAPWVTIDGPGRVATCLRRAGREVRLGC